MVLTPRGKGMTQVVGYIQLEKGVYLFGLTVAGRVPLLVEDRRDARPNGGRIHHGDGGVPHEPRAGDARLRAALGVARVNLLALVLAPLAGMLAAAADPRRARRRVWLLAAAAAHLALLGFAWAGRLPASPLLWLHFDPLGGLVIINKQYASSFFGTSLAAMLTARGVDTLINDQIKNDPDNPNLLFERSRLYYNQRLVDKASEDINRAIELDSTKAPFYLHQSDVFYARIKSRAKKAI